MAALLSQRHLRRIGEVKKFLLGHFLDTFTVPPDVRLMRENGGAGRGGFCGLRFCGEVFPVLGNVSLLRGLASLGDCKCA